MAESAGTPSQRPTSHIAIVGLACRLPGAPTPGAFWRLLSDGGSAITRLPAGRWPADPQSPPVFAGLLDRVDTFDAGFFGIPPREAAEMDPQQRLVLELAWEALEDAGVRPESLARSRTAVFTGAIWDDYAALAHRRDPNGTTPYTMTGLHRSVIANRISHQLGLRGPSMTVDTAQSSGLVAVHLACESLRRGEADLALAGGVNLILAPDSVRAAQERFAGLSPDGHCHTFDARANGFVRGEGGGLVLLKPLQAALADGDPLHCVVLGSAVNNDGDTDGLTRPSAAAQEEVIRLAYERAGVDPEGVQYVELHGTGTPVGDPIEAASLGAALGRRRPAGDPLLVGSAKTNVGHLEAAAGVVGLLKAALSIRHREIPATLNHRTPHPLIPLADLGLSVPTEPTGWPRPQERLIAGVSSFGMGGTNCHMVLAEPPCRPEGDDGPRTTPPAVAWPLSAVTTEALAGQAAALGTWLDADPAADPVDVGHSLLTTRTAFDHRAVVLGADRAELRARLSALAEGREAIGLVRGRVRDGDVAVMFSGQGSQRAGMGRELAAAHPVFADALREACGHLDAHLDRPLLDLLFSDPGPDGQSPLDHTAVTQPALFAVEVALYRLAESWGLRPDHLIGHSVGGIVAAHVSGALPLPDACTLVAARGRLMQAVSERGAMAAWQATEDEAREALRAHSGAVGLAAVNSPSSVVVSGDREAVLAATDTWRATGRRATTLRVSHAFHSPHMDGILEELRTVAAGLSFGKPAVPVVSDLTGRPASAEELRSPEYWARHARQPVRFADGVRHLYDAGVATFVELGPQAALTAMARECFAALPSKVPRPAAVATARRDRPEDDAFVAAMAHAHVRGVPVDLGRLFEGHRPRRIPLPSYAFQRERHWLETSDAPGTEAPRTPPVAGRPTAPEPAVTPDADRASLLALVRGATATVLGYDSPDRVDSSLTFKRLGFDSLAATELAERLGEATGLPLPATLTFERPTPAAVADHLGALRDGDGQPQAPVRTGRLLRDEDDPVAVVAMGCRYPGDADSAEALWHLVDEGVDAVGPFPHDRGWDLAGLLGSATDGAGGSSTGQGGFLRDAAGFDAEFFGISPREALAMDPQQRLLLELSWEVLEGAGVDPASLRSSATGVFVGATATDYSPRLHEATAELEGHLLTGAASSVASGRIAYTLGLEGPAITVDTACSSSLVALHLAARALRDGECDLALAGGVTVMATPGMFTGFSRQRGLAADGRCKPFAAAADGTGWGEGAGLLLLERLSDARRNGHRVLAVVRGSAVNQDGASNGLTAPSGPSQERVIRQALANAGLTAADVDAVEAHGTGTTLGDPIEARALIAAYGSGRPAERPLWLGSVKSNIGHTQAAAGVAGVIKMVMAMQHGTLPASLHIDEPTPHVDWGDGTVRLLGEARDWPQCDRPRRAAVSSFGISGTNAHVILEAPAPEAPPTSRTADAGPEDGVVLAWPLSARTPAALRDRAREMAAFATDSSVPLTGIGWTLASGPVFEHRAVAVGAGRDELLTALEALATGGITDTPAVVPGPGPVLVFPGQGSQWVGMGVELLDGSPVFAERIAECEKALSSFVDWSLTDVLRGGEGAPGYGRVDVVQPVLWAVMVSLAAVWAHHGVVPAAVVGHSQGEIAAACVAGALTLEDGARVVALRSKALRALAGQGTMASLGSDSDTVTALLADLGDRAADVGIAAYNSPSSTVVSGPSDQVAAAVAACEATGARARLIDVDYASHGPQVDQIADEVRTFLADVAPRATDTAFHSTVTGEPIDTTGLDADYWLTNLRRPVRLTDAVESLLEAGHRVFVEASAHPVLIPGLQQAFEAAQVTAAAVPTLRRDEGGLTQLARAFGQAFAVGAPVDWTVWYAALDGTAPVDLPTYAFQRERFWLSAPNPRTATDTDRDPVEAELWGAVEDQDVEALARVMGLDGGKDDTEALRPALPVLSDWRRRHRELRAVESWRYHTRFTPLPEPGTPAPSGEWLLLAPADDPEHPALHTVRAALEDYGATVRVHPVDTRRTDRGPLAAELAALNQAPAGVVSLLALDERPHPDHPAVPAGLTATTTVVQALGDADLTAPLWCLTSGAVSTGPDEPLPHPLQAQIWGLGRVIALEHPNRWGGLIDLPVEPDARTPTRLAALLTGDRPEDQVAIRAGGVLARRLVHAPTGRPVADPPELRGSVLITGGTGGIGGLLAHWAVGRGASHLVLVSRRGPAAPGAAELAARLRERGASVTVAACDVADREALRGLLDALPAEHPLSTVIHAAGVTDYDLVADLDADRFDRMLEPKAHSAAHLHELTRDMDLAAFVLFSSASAVWGSGQQGAYAAANAYLDALAEHRRGLGLPATSLAWGPWAEVGMSADDTSLDFFRRRGLHPLDPATAVTSLGHALDHGDTTATVAAVDWRRFLVGFTALRPSPLLSDLPEAVEQRPEEGTDTADAKPLQGKLAGRPAAEQRHVLVRHVQTHAASVLGHDDPDAVPPGKPFQELGFDSITAVQLRDQLNASTGLRLPTTVLFDHPNAEELARYLHGELVEGQAAGEERILAELDVWDAAHPPQALDDAARSRVAARLALLASRWDDRDGAANRDSAHRDLESATADDIFALISEEFGKS